MNTVKEFEKRFSEEIIDILILTKETVNGAAVMGDMLKPSLAFAASVDMRTGEFSQKTGRLEWLIENKKDRPVLWGYDFKQFQIYHIKARKNIPVKLEPYMLETLNNCYMVVEIVEENVSEPRLAALREHFLTPVIIEDDDLGRFVLEREFSSFSGSIDWLGESCRISLDTDEEDGETAEKSFAILKELYQNLKEWDDKLCAFAAKELTTLANDWLMESADKEAEPEKITEEDFAKRIYICELSIIPDGTLTLYYYDDDMFYGHIIVIEANIDGELESANIEG